MDEGEEENVGQRCTTLALTDAKGILTEAMHGFRKVATCDVCSKPLDEAFAICQNPEAGRGGGAEASGAHIHVGHVCCSACRESEVYIGERGRCVVCVRVLASAGSASTRSSHDSASSRAGLALIPAVLCGKASEMMGVYKRARRQVEESNERQEEARIRAQSDGRAACAAEVRRRREEEEERRRAEAEQEERRNKAEAEAAKERADRAEAARERAERARAEAEQEAERARVEAEESRKEGEEAKEEAKEEAEETLRRAEEEASAIRKQAEEEAAAEGRTARRKAPPSSSAAREAAAAKRAATAAAKRQKLEECDSAKAEAELLRRQLRVIVHEAMEWVKATFGDAATGDLVDELQHHLDSAACSLEA